MKPPPFEYHRPSTLDEALALLVRHGSDARLLAGGQSLLPMMKLRLARPAVLVDLNRVRELAYVRGDDGVLAFGALARLSELESDTVRARCPMLAAAARHIGHPAIRHRGTVCGSLAHADPAAELPVLALALDAELSVAGPSGARRVAAQNFFAHVAPDGSDLRKRLQSAGYGYQLAAENLGLAAGALAAHFSIEQSPGHLRNLIDGRHARLGVGVAYQKLDGQPQAVVTEILAQP